MKRLMIIILCLAASLQVACCSQSFSYPVIVDVTKIEVSKGAGSAAKEIADSSQIDQTVRFIDERRSRWCSPRFGSLPEPEATLTFHVNKGGRSVIGFGDGFFVADFSGGRYKMDISGEEAQEFLKVLGISKEQVFGK